MSLSEALFWFFALSSCGSAAGVVLTQNVVRMAVWLILCLGSVAALIFTLGAPFVGSTQLLIYVGGTVVLLVFGVMLTATGPLLKIRSSPADLLAGAAVGALLLFLIAFTVGDVDWSEVQSRQPVAEVQSSESTSTASLGVAFLGPRPDRGGEAASSGGYLLPFEIVSVHLLVVLVGAAYLSRAKRRRASLEDGV